MEDQVTDAAQADNSSDPAEMQIPNMLFMAEVSITNTGAMSVRIHSNMEPLAQLGAIEVLAENVRSKYLQHGTQAPDNEPLILT